jgi:opacity protein-like surface antigen
MKKIILAALVAFVSVSANAQFWAGGSVGFNTSKTSIDGNELSKENQFRLIPEIGYKLNDKWDIAVALGYNHISGKGIDSQNGFAINPYARYTFAQCGDFSFFADGGFSYGFNHTSGVEDNLNAWEIAIKPGISYALSEKVSLVAHVGNVGWVFKKQGDVKENTFDVGVTNAITFGAYVSFDAPKESEKIQRAFKKAIQLFD